MLLKKPLKTIIFTSEVRFDLCNEIEQFQIKNPKNKIINIQYGYSRNIESDGFKQFIVETHSAMIVYK